MVHRDGDEYSDYLQTKPKDNVRNDDDHKGRHIYDVPSDHTQNSDNQAHVLQRHGEWTSFPHKIVPNIGNNRTHCCANDNVLDRERIHYYSYF